ncbi:hypothetical protein GWK47_018605 [Chionoecetes opilio]|uniref:Uncharacterized protein n=1 Tax=Chionoecetes opilio TaxID=41210 RepID=A0A8J4XT08_CHIOP|nr:hypothetical protein GWK47_018605 [Chionoecetes opilio]
MKENSSTFGILVKSETIVNKNKIENVLGRRSRTDSPVCAHEDRGELQVLLGSVRPKRSKSIQGTSGSIFQLVTSVPRMTQSHCTGVLTDSQWVKHSLRSTQKTQDDHVRVQDGP